MFLQAVAMSPEQPEVVVNKYLALLDRKKHVSAMDKHMDTIVRMRDG